MTTISNSFPAGARALERVNQALRPVARGLEFSRDESTGETVIRVVDTSTQEVLRQIPSEAALAIARALDHMQGVLVNEKA